CAKEGDNFWSGYYDYW
nr:immunoglobulin heavy chain junction region [Macaca mulatta]